MRKRIAVVGTKDAYERFIGRKPIIEMPSRSVAYTSREEYYHIDTVAKAQGREYDTYEVVGPQDELEFGTVDAVKGLVRPHGVAADGGKGKPNS